MLNRECNRMLRSFLSCACFVPKLLHDAKKKFNTSQTKWMRQRLSKLHCFISPLEGLVWVAEDPQSHGYVRQTIYLNGD